MAGQLQHLRSSTESKRPTASGLADGSIAINTASGSPGLFFKNSAGAVVKVGPVHVGSSAPNATPASGGSSGNSVGEQWLDNSGGTYVFKIWDGSAWRSEAGEFVNTTGDTMTGDLVMNDANIVFEGSIEDGFETTLTVVNPTADRTITFPNVTGTVVTTGDSGTVTSTMIADGTIVNADINSSAAIAPSKIGAGALPTNVTVASANIVDGTIVNADVNASAAIAGTKIDPDFGSQTIETTGVINAGAGTEAAPSVSVRTTDNGLYSPGTDQVAISTNGTGALFVDDSGKVSIGSATSALASQRLTINYDTNSSTFSECQLLRIDGAGAVDEVGGIGFGYRNSSNSGEKPSAFIGNIVNNNSGAKSSHLVFATRSVTTDTEPLERLRITSVGTLMHLGAGDSTSPAVQFNGSAPANSMVMLSDGKVGLGTSSPQALGHFSNTAGSAEVRITCGGSAVSGESILRFGNANDQTMASIRFDSTSDNLSFYSTNDTHAMTIDSSQRVGIGTTSPSSQLHLQSANPNFRLENTSTTGASVIQFGDPDDIDVGSIRYEHNGDALRFITNADERARIDSSGRLLVGTTTEGDANADDLTIASSGNTGITIRSGTTNRGNIYFSDGTSGAAEYRGYIEYNHDGDKLTLATANSSQIIIDSSGNITVSDGGDVVLGTTTGTKIGTATSQKIGFYNATPVVQPTTGVAEAAFVENSGGTAVNVDSTFGGYTIQQVVEALQTLGLLA